MMEISKPKLPVARMRRPFTFLSNTAVVAQGTANRFTIFME